MRRQRRWTPRGGIGTTIDLVAGIFFWIVLLFLLINLVQIGRAWQITQNATYDAAQGVAAYGCWTAQVTDVARSDLANLTLAPGQGATATVTQANGQPTGGQAIYVSTRHDPAMVVQINVPIVVGGWLHIPLIPVTMHGQTTVTSDAYHQSQLGTGGDPCETPQL